MDGFSAAQIPFDFRTGRPTAVDYHTPCAVQRAACTALNRERTRGILQAAQSPSSRESVSADVWQEAFARTSQRLEVPLIPLSHLGIHHDADGIPISDYLIPLKPGAEASPYWDREFQCVYKLFDLRHNGGLGKKMILQKVEEDRYDLVLVDATLTDTLTKLSVLSDAGALPTEIVGLSDTGDYLIAKQPLAHEARDFEKDRHSAIQAMLGEVPLFSGLTRTVAIIHVNGAPWLVSDLHNRNIMRDREGHPTVIDALTGDVPAEALRSLAWLRDGVEDAHDRRHGLPRRQRLAFGDDVSDDDL